MESSRVSVEYDYQTELLVDGILVFKNGNLIVVAPKNEDEVVVADSRKKKGK